VFIKMFKDLCQDLGVQNQAVGVPDEDGTGSGAIDPMGRLDVLKDFLQWTFFKRCILVHGAKGALVPRATTGDPQ
jgi:hypothetical protein